eukprot:CAMPEP_0181092762 /NCGR_PEP_ID=MMETSP1071-20121207/9086_1 /TAXON_ID=35127 /ORGANISM="Thalassiosira sp., Strain NH16" /LENGTH=949 /DNA_ID=CAMNT_0023174953 /DNA_START=5 /DNA_END=2854 /DNA_ORIENTATION=-
MTRNLVLAAASALLVQWAHASKPTSYIDIHLITSFSTTGSLETGYLFRIPASESNFAGSPPKGPKWATHSALTGGTSSGKDPDNLASKTSNRVKVDDHPQRRLKLPPDSDEFLCNESKGAADYTNPAGNAASAVFDSDTLLSGYEGTYVLVPRGHCTFEAKARSAQRLGALGVIVRNTLDSKYRLLNETEDDRFDTTPHWSNTKWPVEQRDYDCGDNGASNKFGLRAEVDASQFAFAPNAPYYGAVNDPLLTGPAVDGNLCAQAANVDSFEGRCPSERCLLTGRNATDDGTMLEACCAWDLFLRMSTDGDDDGDAVPQEEEEDITIPALFVTMENGEELYDLVVDAGRNSERGDSVQFVNVVPYQRWYPSVHYSSIVVWLLAVVTLGVSAYASAVEYRSSWKKISKAVNDGVLVFQTGNTDANATGRERANTEDTVDLADETLGELELVTPEVEMTNQASENGGTSAAIPSERPSFTIDDAEADDFVGNPNPTSPKPGDGTSNGAEDSDSMTNESLTNDSSFEPVDEEQQPPSEAASPSTPRQQRSQSSTAETQNMELNAFHAVMFVVAASCFLFILFFFKQKNVIRVFYGLAGSVAMNQVVFYPLYVLLCSRFLPDRISSKAQANAFGNLPGCRGHYFKWIDVVSSATGYAVALAWIVVGFSTAQPMTNAYYWVIQDVIGVCFCVLILGVIHINMIMVATILLSFLFIYDVFYVLISPMIFGSSVMLDVASGGANGIDPTFCEKYPSDSRCPGTFAPLPMLLAIPWFNDFRGGFSMIGLGDIILPGLLISFAARFDAARGLMKKCSRISSIRSGENAADDETDAAGESSSSTGGSSRNHYHLGRVKASLFHGYFGPLMIAYGIGLLVAYIAVWATNRGQPALLYLVPACLGTTLFLGWRRRELSDLWVGPKAMRKANKMVAMAGRIPEARAVAAREANNNVAETSSVV